MVLPQICCTLGGQVLTPTPHAHPAGATVQGRPGPQCKNDRCKGGGNSWELTRTQCCACDPVRAGAAAGADACSGATQARALVLGGRGEGKTAGDPWQNAPASSQHHARASAGIAASRSRGLQATPADALHPICHAACRGPGPATLAPAARRSALNWQHMHTPQAHAWARVQDAGHAPRQPCTRRPHLPPPRQPK